MGDFSSVWRITGFRRIGVLQGFGVSAYYRVSAYRRITGFRRIGVSAYYRVSAYRRITGFRRIGVSAYYRVPAYRRNGVITLKDLDSKHAAIFQKYSKISIDH